MAGLAEINANMNIGFDDLSAGALNATSQQGSINAMSDLTVAGAANLNAANDVMLGSIFVVE